MSSIKIAYKPEMSVDDWINMYEQWCYGNEEWRRQEIFDGEWNPPDLFSKSPQKYSLDRPRVFISHRQGDEKSAERVAKIADDNGFYFWLDVVNMPLPAAIQKMTSKAIALRIEMALLNCTHLVAIYTDKTKGSSWVPYEYGRVKAHKFVTSECCSWICTSDYPEWIELNPTFTSERDLASWFLKMFKEWSKSSISPIPVNHKNKPTSTKQLSQICPNQD